MPATWSRAKPSCCARWAFRSTSRAATGAPSAPRTDCDPDFNRGDAVMPAAQSTESNPAAATPSASERLVDQLANRIGGLGVELADVAGNLQELAGRVSCQSHRFGQFQKTPETMVSANHGIPDASQAGQSATTSSAG